MFGYFISFLNLVLICQVLAKPHSLEKTGSLEEIPKTGEQDIQDLMANKGKIEGNVGQLSNVLSVENNESPNSINIQESFQRITINDSNTKLFQLLDLNPQLKLDLGLGELLGVKGHNQTIKQISDNSVTMTGNNNEIFRGAVVNTQGVVNLHLGDILKQATGLLSDKPLTDEGCQALRNKEIIQKQNSDLTQEGENNTISTLAKVGGQLIVDANVATKLLLKLRCNAQRRTTERPLITLPKEPLDSESEEISVLSSELILERSTKLPILATTPFEFLLEKTTASAAEVTPEISTEPLIISTTQTPSTQSPTKPPVQPTTQLAPTQANAHFMQIPTQPTSIPTKPSIKISTSPSTNPTKLQTQLLPIQPKTQPFKTPTQPTLTPTTQQIQASTLPSIYPPYIALEETTPTSPPKETTPFPMSVSKPPNFFPTDHSTAQNKAPNHIIIRLPTKPPVLYPNQSLTFPSNKSSISLFTHPSFSDSLISPNQKPAPKRRCYRKYCRKWRKTKYQCLNLK